MSSHKIEVRKEAVVHKAALRQAGVNFSDTKFAAYIQVEDVVMQASAAAANITEAQSLVADGSEANLTDAILAITDSNYPEFETCSNAEWLQVYGGYDTGDDSGNQEDETDWAAFDEHVENIKDKFDDGTVEFASARGQRIMCHGWNGANFTHHNKGVATFDVLTEDAEKLFDSIN